MKGEKKTMKVIINYKEYNKDDSYDIKAQIVPCCEGVISRGSNELLLVQGDKSARFFDVTQFSIIED